MFRRFSRLGAGLALVTVVAGVQLVAAAAPSSAAACTRVSGSIKGSDGSAVDAQIGVDIADADGRLLRAAGYEGPYGTTPVNVNTSLPAVGAPAHGHAMSWQSDCFQLPAGAKWIAVEVYPKAPTATRPTDKSKFGAVEVHGIEAKPGDVTANLVLPVRSGNGYDGVTGDVHGYVTYNGKPLPGADVNGNKQFKVKLWPYDTAGSCGTHGWSADSDNDWNSADNGYFRIEAIAAGQCGADSQTYTIHLECDSTLCGAEPGRTRMYTPSPDHVEVRKGQTTFWGFSLFGPSRAVTPFPPSAPTLTASTLSVPASGGRVTLTSTSKYASGITLAAEPDVEDWSQTIPVDADGSMTTALSLPPNTTDKPITYTVTATANSSVGDTAGASVRIVQRALFAYAVRGGVVWQRRQGGWRPLGGEPMSAVAASQTGAVYGISSRTGSTYRWDPTAQAWREIYHGLFASIATGGDGVLYGVNAVDRDTYAWSGGAWTQVAQLPFRSIAVGGSTLYGVDANTGLVWSRDGTTAGWQQLSTTPAASVVASDGAVFMTGTDGAIAQWVAGAWQQVDNGFMTRAVAGNGTVYAFDKATGGLYQYTGTTGWVELYQGLLSDVVAGNGSVYGVNGVTGVTVAYNGTPCTDDGSGAPSCDGWDRIGSLPVSALAVGNG